MYLKKLKYLVIFLSCACMIKNENNHNLVLLNNRSLELIIRISMPKWLTYARHQYHRNGQTPIM